MTNSKTIFKQKSKLLLTLLCLFGLAFSYSCSCRDDNPYNPGPPSSDPTVFTITANIAETRLVQKASDSTLAYQPSIKFSEANGNEYTVDYEVTDNDTANKIEKANITYKKEDGSITFDKTAVLDKLTTDKKTIQIIFAIKATNENLKSPETNFTLSVDLKKTKGTLEVQTVVGKLFKDIFSFTIENTSIQFEDEAEATQIIGKVNLGVGDKNPKEMSQKNFNKAFIAALDKKAEEKNNKFYKSITLVDNYDAGDKKWSFVYKLTFSDEDYDLTDEQKSNGVEYILTIKGKDSEYISWIDK